MIGMRERTLRAGHVTLRLLADGDASALRELLRLREVTEPAGFLPAGDDPAFERFFDTLTQYDTGLAILCEDTLVGYIHVYPYDPEMPEYVGKTCVGMGFVIGKEYWGHGYASEALRTLTAYLKTRFDHCFVDHFEGNAASKRVIEKCGYRYCDTYTMRFDALGREMTCLSYVF